MLRVGPHHHPQAVEFDSRENSKTNANSATTKKFENLQTRA